MCGRQADVSACPLTAALAAMGGKWKLIIVYWLAESPKHFAAIRRAMPGISQKVLTQQLRELERDELCGDERLEGHQLPSSIRQLTTADRCCLWWRTSDSGADLILSDLLFSLFGWMSQT